VQFLACSLRVVLKSWLFLSPKYIKLIKILLVINILFNICTTSI